jgi:TRAP-type C4-dicarboxylate transport system permease large subunit
MIDDWFVVVVVVVVVGIVGVTSYRTSWIKLCYDIPTKTTTTPLMIMIVISAAYQQ